MGSSGGSRRKDSPRTRTAPSRFSVLFYGTPAFALPTLRALLQHHTVVTVITQPDRPAHRGQRLTPPPVKVAAEAAGVPVLQPWRLRDPEWPARLRGLGADVAIVVAFGQILPLAVLQAPPRGSINVHGSILPKYRGAAPIQWAVIRGERETGVTTFQMDPGMDTGDVLLTRSTPIGAEETAGELSQRLSQLGAELLLETLERLDSIVPTPQRHEDATLAPRLKKSDGTIDWSRPASVIANLARGCNPWPGATTPTPAGTLVVWRARAVEGRAAPGTLVAWDDTLAVGAGDGLVLPIEVQPENRRGVRWADYLRGARLLAGTRLVS